MRQLLIGLVLVFAVAARVEAASTAFTSRASFDAAVAGIAGATPVTTTDFEGVAGGTPVPNGTGFGGVTFSSNLASPASLAIHSFAGTSGSNTLGVSSDGGVTVGRFGLGDVIDFQFSKPTHGFGLYIIVSPGHTFFAEDIDLSFGGLTSSSTGSTTTSEIGPNHVAAVFAGIVDPTTTFTSASLRFGPAGSIRMGAGAFEIDDLVRTSVAPLPQSLLLLGTGLAGLGLIRARIRPAARA